MYMTAIKPSYQNGEATASEGKDEWLDLFAYVGNDPINFIDPLGLCEEDGSSSYPGENCDPIVVTATRRPSAWLSSGGGGGGSYGGDVRGRGGLSHAPQPQPRPRENQCTAVLQEQGAILAEGTTVTAILGLGITKTEGTFRNLRTGSSGSYVTYGVGVGGLAGVSETQSTYRDIRSFVGYWESVSFGASIPFAGRIPLIGKYISKYVGIGASLHKNVDGQSVGKTSDVGPGRNGAAAVASETIISNCTNK